MQKTVKNVSGLNTSYSGILDVDRFDEHFERRYYKPSKNLEPFIAHIWTQRQKKPFYTPLEICSEPSVYLFLTAKSASIHGTVAGKLRYDALTPGVIVGVKFKPGGFYPFYRRPMIRLADNTLSADSVFPEITTEFVQTLQQQNDKEIIRSIEKILCSHDFKQYTGFEMIDRIMHIIDKDTHLQSVPAIARGIGRSERAVQLLFHHHVGISLKWAINRKRLLKTIDTVMSSGSSWTHAAAEAGYSNQSHFTRDFKNAVGMSPSQYRKNV